MPEFKIHPLACGGGILALSPMPGRTRHYGTDWQRLLDWAPDLVITMTTLHELARKEAGSFGPDLAAVGIAWQHMPVDDFGTPTEEVTDKWPGVASEALTVLGQGGRVLIHCYGGCGRSGMAVLRLMIAAGEAADAALARLREMRPCAVETPEQLHWATGF